jgi:hypothetical protein
MRASYCSGIRAAVICGFRGQPEREGGVPVNQSDKRSRGHFSDYDDLFFSDESKRSTERVDMSPFGTEGCQWVLDYSYLEDVQDKQDE